jgi:hypothetical protein
MKKSKILGTKNSLLFENVDAQENRLLTSSRDILYGVGKSKWIVLREKYKPKAFKVYRILDGGTIVLDTHIDLLTSTLAFLSHTLSNEAIRYIALYSQQPLSISEKRKLCIAKIAYPIITKLCASLIQSFFRKKT